MKSIVLCGDHPSAPINKLQNLGFTVISMPRFFSLDFPINSHCEMLMSIFEGYIITSEDYASLANKQFEYICDNTGLGLITEKSPHLNGYPAEAKYNVLYHNKKLYCNTNYVSPSIYELCKRSSVPIIHTNQGYSACSVAKCSNGVITSDPSLVKAFNNNSENVLYISKGYIAIDKYPYGFIGGASGYCAENSTLYINGDINLHPDANEIIRFCELHNTHLYSLAQNSIPFDIGGIIFI